MTNLIDVANIVKIIKNLWNLQNSSTFKILIFWPKMTKCQTNLVRKKIFIVFLTLFRLRIIQFEKKKFWKIFIFLKFLNDPTSFLNDPDLFGQYSLVIEFLSSCFHLIPKIRTSFWPVFKISCYKSAKIAILSCIIEWSWTSKIRQN